MRRRYSQHIWIGILSLAVTLAAISSPLRAQQVYVDESATRLPITTGNSLKPVLVDVNGDGAPDVFLASAGQSRLLINDGSGVFTDETSRLFLQIPGFSGGATACDVDSDGDADLFVVGSGVGTLAQDRLWMNDGSGRFTDKTSSLLPTDTDIGASAMCVDVNGDTHPDIIVANVGQNRLLLNDGTGHFTDETFARLPTLNDASTGVAVLDADGDGDPDLFIANAGQSRLLLNDGTGVFTDATTTNLPALSDVSNAVVALDADGDGDPDLFIANAGQSRLLLNDGTGVFTDATTTNLPALSNISTGVAALDAEGDGDTDLFIANAGQNQLLLNDGSGVFTDATTTELPSRSDNSTGVVAGDIDGDGKTDLFVTNLGETNRVLINAGMFLDETATRLPVVNDLSLGAVMGDVNGDGHIDIFTPTSAQNTLFVNTGQGSFKDMTASNLPPASNFSTDAVVGDVNGDGHIDLIVANSGPSLGVGAQNRLLLNDGTGHFTDQTTSRMPTLSDPSEAILLGDVDGDGDPDVLVINFFGQNRLLLNDGTGHFTDATAGRLPTVTDLSLGAALGDIDGDGDPDVVIANLGQNTLLLNDGTGHFSDETSTRLPVLSDFSAAAVFGDVDGDRDPDLYIANSGEQSRLLMNDGTGHFSDETATRLPTFTDETATALLIDVDNDGDMDIFLANHSPNRLLINDGTGHFSDETADRLPGGDDNSEGAAAGDVNGDGWIDLFIGNFFGQNQLLINHSPDITQVLPSSGAQGETLDVIITGVNTTFSEGTSVVSFGDPCIAIDTTSVANETTMLATISIAPTCELGMRDVTVTTNAEVAIGENSFEVTAPVEFASISGTVTRASTGAPIAGAKVKLRSTTFRTKRSTTTNADGFYTFTDLEPGSYTITATKFFFFRASDTATVGPGEERTVDLVIPLPGRR